MFTRGSSARAPAMGSACTGNYMFEGFSLNAYVNLHTHTHKHTHTHTHTHTNTHTQTHTHKCVYTYILVLDASLVRDLANDPPLKENRYSNGDTYEGQWLK